MAEGSLWLPSFPKEVSELKLPLSPFHEGPIRFHTLPKNSKLLHRTNGDLIGFLQELVSPLEHSIGLACHKFLHVLKARSLTRHEEVGSEAN